MKPKRRKHNVFPAGTYNALFERIIYKEREWGTFARLKFLVINEDPINTENIATYREWRVNDKAKFEAAFTKKFGGTPFELHNVPFEVELIINEYALNSVSNFELNEEWGIPIEVCEWIAKRRTPEEMQERRKKDPVYDAVITSREALKAVLDNKATEAQKELIGATCVDLRAYITAQFKKGWNWSNRGTAWVLDHVLSLSKGRTPEEVYKRAHYKNLKPIEPQKNRAKSNAGV